MSNVLTLAAELDETVCDEKPRAELREYIAAELEAICVRFEIEKRKWKIKVDEES